MSIIANLRNFSLKKGKEMVVISTFVMFDLETTGLPRYESNQTKITELTFLAVDRTDIETATYGHVPPINKLSYLFNPQRNIQPEVCSLTGLTNDLLQNQPIFKSRIQSLNFFLKELPKPVCLVAHNGNSFDFKILQSEYSDAGATLPNDLLCVDSLWGFKKILKETDLSYKTLIATGSLPIPSSSKDDLLTDDEDWPDMNTTPEEWEEIDKLVEKFSKMSPQKNDNSKSTLHKVKVTTSNEHIKMKKAMVIEKVFDKKPRTENISCTLQALYKRLLNKEAINAHRSEADCVMLLECVVALNKYFLPYADAKCKPISEIKPIQRY